MRRLVHALPERELALRLRYHIDMARKYGLQHEEALRSLLADSPRALESSHIRHNLGKDRIAWLEGWR